MPSKKKADVPKKAIKKAAKSKPAALKAAKTAKPEAAKAPTPKAKRTPKAKKLAKSHQPGVAEVAQLISSEVVFKDRFSAFCTTRSLSPAGNTTNATLSATTAA